MGFSLHRWRQSSAPVLTERRTVYPSAEVPHLWAHGLPDGRTVRNAGRSIYAEGRTIYSYGQHFPMARRVELKSGEVVYLVNPGRYSTTTAGHQSAVRQAIPHGARTFHIPPGERSRYSGNQSAELWRALEDGNSAPLVDYYRGAIVSAATEATKPRIRPETVKRHLDRISGLVAEWGVIHSLFGFRCSLDRVTAPADLDGARETVKREAENIKRAEARAAKALAVRNAQAAKEAAERRKEAELLILPAWRRGGPGRTGLACIRDLGYPAFRVDPEDARRIESSEGARVPLEDAERLWRILPRLMPKEGERTSLDERIGVYGPIGVTQDALEIGCHRIPLSEVEAFAAFMGWERNHAHTLPES